MSDPTENYIARQGGWEDGKLMSIVDIARAARTTAKVAKRALESYEIISPREGVIVFSLDHPDLPSPDGMTKPEFAVAIAKVVGIGRFGTLKRAAERALTQPVQKPKERPVAVANHHPWKEGQHGRSIQQKLGGRFTATIACKCGAADSISLAALTPPDAIDNKFKQRGWRLDPTKCPACINPGKEKTMASSAQPSPMAVTANAKMFRLINEQFDIDSGTYAKGWSDDKVASESGVALAMVAAVREEAFGPLKEPPEVAQLTGDIAAVEALLAEEETRLRSIREMVEGLKIKQGDLRRKFAA